MPASLRSKIHVSSYQCSITVSAKPTVKENFYSGAFFSYCFLQKYCGFLKECRNCSRAEWQCVTKESRNSNKINKYVGLTSMQMDIRLHEFFSELLVSRSLRHKNALCGHHVCPHVTQYQWLNRLTARDPLSVTEPSVRTSPSISDYTVCRIFVKFGRVLYKNKETLCHQCFLTLL